MKRVRRPQSFWEETIAEFYQSHLDKRSFCRREKLVVSTFENWERKLRRESAIEPTSKPAVVHIATTTSGAAIEACLPSGAVLRFPASVDADYVARLLCGVLAQSC